jgi:hypothetical protein
MFLKALIYMGGRLRPASLKLLRACVRACVAAHACVIDTVYQLIFLLVGPDPAGVEDRIFV